MTADVVFLLDVDNTLLDNDRVIADLRAPSRAEFGAASADRYWEIFEQLRDELGYADYLGALQRYRAEVTRATTATTAAAHVELPDRLSVRRSAVSARARRRRAAARRWGRR